MERGFGSALILDRYEKDKKSPAKAGLSKMLDACVVQPSD
jgi:hypothetical protein